MTVLVIAPAAALAGHQFTDVPNSNIFHDDIEWMRDNGVTAGCNPPANTEYCPGDNVTRQEMAAFIHRLDTENVFVRPGDDAVDGGNADTVDGMHASDFLGANEKAVDSDKLDGKDSTAYRGEAGSANTDTNMDIASGTIEILSVTITLEAESLILASSNVEVDADGGNDDDAFCYLSTGAAFGDDISERVTVDIPDTNFARANIANHGSTLQPAGTYTVRVFCGVNVAGQAISMDSADLLVWSVPT